MKKLTSDVAAKSTAVMTYDARINSSVKHRHDGLHTVYVLIYFAIICLGPTSCNHSQHIIWKQLGGSRLLSNRWDISKNIVCAERIGELAVYMLSWLKFCVRPCM